MSNIHPYLRWLASGAPKLNGSKPEGYTWRCGCRQDKRHDPYGEGVGVVSVCLPHAKDRGLLPERYWDVVDC